MKARGARETTVTRVKHVLLRLVFSFTAIGIVSSASVASATPFSYTVYFDGPNIDLTGYIVANSLGRFTSSAFDANIVDYSLTASSGGFAHTFTLANSTWGGFGYGANVLIDVTAGAIQLTAPLGSDFDGGNLFLLADVVTNGAMENLRFYQDHLGYRQSNPPDSTVFDTVSPQFTLATASVQETPEPASLLLMGTGLVACAARFRRKRTG